MLSNYKLKKIESNLEYFYNISDKKTGLNWYKDANSFCIQLSKKYNIEIYKIASVLSALSPRNKWAQNKKDTIKVVEAFKNGINPEQIKVCTFHKNKFKAFNILKDSNKIKPKSPKTYAFLQNIAYLNDRFVTIDVWHIRASFDKMIIKKSLTLLEYKQVENITLRLAKKYNLKGYQLQAIIWEQIRNNY